MSAYSFSKKKKNLSIFPPINIFIIIIDVNVDSGQQRAVAEICHCVICASKRVHIAFVKCMSNFDRIIDFVGAGDRITHSGW